MKYAALILILSAGAANAKVAESFKCQAGFYWKASGKVVVTATINEDGETGTIKVAGITHQAKYQVQGFDRRWDFDMQTDFSYNYAFVLSPDGKAIYYDFSSVGSGETVRGKQVFICK